MYLRRLVSRLSTLATQPAIVRPLSTTSTVRKAPTLSDIEPDKGYVFDQKQQKFRDDLLAAQQKREEAESKSPELRIVMMPLTPNREAGRAR